MKYLIFDPFYIQRFSVRCDYEGLIHDGQLIHQYQQSKQSHLTSKSLTTIKTRTHNVRNPGSSLGQEQHSFVDISDIVDHHCFHFLFVISTISFI